MSRVTRPAGNSSAARRFAPVACRGESGAYGAASPVSARAVAALAPAGSGAAAEARRRLHGDRRRSEAARLPPGSVSTSPGRPPALVLGPGRAGMSFHPHFPLRDSASSCEKTPGSTLPSLPPSFPRCAGVRTARRSLSPQGLHLQVREDLGSGHRVRFGFPLCSLPLHPTRLAPTQGTAGPPSSEGAGDGPAGTPEVGSGYGRHTPSGSLCPGRLLMV